MERQQLLALRRKFAGLPDRAAKQIGLRRIRDALRYVDRPDMADYVARLAAEAAFQLPHAQAWADREAAR